MAFSTLADKSSKFYRENAFFNSHKVHLCKCITASMENLSIDMGGLSL